MAKRMTIEEIRETYKEVVGITRKLLCGGLSDELLCMKIVLSEGLRENRQSHMSSKRRLH